MKNRSESRLWESKWHSGQLWVAFRCPRHLKMDPRVSKMHPRDTRNDPKTPQMVSRRSLRVPKVTPKGSIMSQWSPRLILVLFFVVCCSESLKKCAVLSGPLQNQVYRLPPLPPTSQNRCLDDLIFGCMEFHVF